MTGLWRTVLSTFTPRPREASGESDESWVYFPPVTDGGYQQIEIRTTDGYDFARLTWATCSRCRIGLVAKIRVDDVWQRKGYGTA
jgi:hypothetical protein